jgi:Kef-type K+ transport system membrane component KefB
MLTYGPLGVKAQEGWRGIIAVPNTDLGVVALSCAATDDVTAWCLLAFVVGVARAQVGEGFLVVAGALAYIVGMFLLVRPIVRRTIGRWETDRLPRSVAALVFVALLLSTPTTEFIGIHAIFGAFLLGAVIPLACPPGKQSESHPNVSSV